MFKTAFCISLFLYVLNEVTGRPTNLLDPKDETLVNEFAKFLHQDKELSAILEKEFGSESLNRQRRQTEIDDMNNDFDETPQEKQDGFFDRAAKFMVEMLQRFLKWINTE